MSARPALHISPARHPYWIYVFAMSSWTAIQQHRQKQRQEDLKKNHGRLDSICKATRHHQLLNLRKDIILYHMRTSNCGIWCRNTELTNQVKKKLRAAQSKMGRSMLNTTHREREKIWVREKQRSQT